MDSFDEFLSFAENSHIVIADYNSRKARLDAMLTIRETDKSHLLDKWIADAYRRLEVMKPLYEYALVAEKLPLEEIRVTWIQLKALKQ